MAFVKSPCEFFQRNTFNTSIYLLVKNFLSSQRAQQLSNALYREILVCSIRQMRSYLCFRDCKSESHR